MLGTDDSRALVSEAGGQVCAIDATADYEAVVICDDDGFPFLDGINAALSEDLRTFRKPEINGQPYLGKKVRAYPGVWSLDSGTTYRYDTKAQQYQYNWKSNGAGYYFRLGVALDDGQSYYVTIGLR